MRHKKTTAKTKTGRTLNWRAQRRPKFPGQASANSANARVPRYSQKATGFAVARAEPLAGEPDPDRVTGLTSAHPVSVGWCSPEGLALFAHESRRKVLDLSGIPTTKVPVMPVEAYSPVAPNRPTGTYSVYGGLVSNKPERNIPVGDVGSAVEYLRSVVAFAIEHGYEDPGYCPIEAIAERLNGGAGQIVGRVHTDGSGNAVVSLNGLGSRLPDGTPIYPGVR